MEAEMIHAEPGSGAAGRPTRRKPRFPAAAFAPLIIVAGIATPLAARADQREAAAKLLARTMTNPEFRPKFFRGGAWLGNGDSYLAIEPSASGNGSDIV